MRSVKDEKKVKHLRDLCPGAKHKLELVEADLTKPETWLGAVSGCKYVHHVASPFPLGNPKTADELIKPAVEGTLAVLKACKTAGGVARVVLTSSILVIAETSGNTTPYTENDWVDHKSKPANFYIQSKILAEKAAWEFVKDLPDGEKFELAAVNPSLIAGPTLHGTPGSSMEPVRRLLTRDFPMVPKFCIPVVDVRDVACAHLKCMELPEAAGHRHLLFGGNIWMQDLAMLLDREFGPQGYNVPTTSMPGFVLSMAGLFDKDLRDTKAMLSKAMKLDNSRMREVLDITPRSPEVTYIDMAYSMVEAGFVPKTAKFVPRGTSQS